MGISITHMLKLARSGMLARMLDLDVVSNNLANVSTPGFKSSRASFQEFLNETSELAGVRLQATQRDMRQGSVRPSSNPLDLAINGEGFFRSAPTR